jgi:glycosyltransferase involved in cell wall biosynthesis
VARDGYQVWYFPAQWPSRWCYAPQLARALAASVRQFDLVHIASLYLYTTQAAAAICRRAGVPYLLRPHGTLDPYLRRRRRGVKWLYDLAWQRRDMQQAAAFHFTTEDEMRLAQEVGLRPPGVVVPLALEAGEFAALPARGEFRAKHLGGWAGPLILYLGRINFKKGVDVLIESFAALSQSRADARLVIVGHADPPPYAAEMRQLAQARNLAGQIVFTGPLFGRDKLAALADADLWVLPSHTENFGMALVEAMLCGLPVITTQNVGVGEEVARAEAGLIVAPTPAEVAGAMARLLDDPAERRRLGANGRRLARAKYSLEAVGAQLEQAYYRVLAGAAPA